ncbi:hypothetical protein [Actinoplanes awajinensis]|uniref:HTH luxR-type domain-containing protein n=1 Tax=Actinoplanes awajinensis subsp. mycoplanecinus TaxID=135947 RepID=A0A101JM54_9ACTN|nr:hypothetical protein [Actinoplanes awajinensis]KUL29444.1 hypothetical protein ADL15_27900 [Actinoplanes awajinensis subsp. mycoplanecinus]
MTGATSHPEMLIFDLADIAHRPCSLVARAEALLTTIRSEIAHDAAFLSLFEPERCLHSALARYGYSRQREQHLDSPAFADELAARGLRGPAPAATILGADPSEIYVPLRAGGDYLGLFGMRTTAPERWQEHLTVVAPIIARAVDPRQKLTAMASLVADPIAATVLTRAGSTEPLPGLPGLASFGPAAPIVAEARALLAAGAGHASFLATGASAEYGKVTVLATAGLPPGHRSGIVLVSHPGDLHGLTRPELTVLGLHLADWDDRRITEHLGLTGATAAGLLDSICRKLTAPHRDAATVQAAAHGLYLPAAPA